MVMAMGMGVGVDVGVGVCVCVCKLTMCERVMQKCGLQLRISNSLQVVWSPNTVILELNSLPYRQMDADNPWKSSYFCYLVA